MAMTAYDKLLSTEKGRVAVAEEHAITNVTELICELLEKNDMRRQELANRMGVSRGRVTQILDGENLTLATVARALYAFGHVLEVSSRDIDDQQAVCVWRVHNHNHKPWHPAKRTNESVAPPPRVEWEPKWIAA